MFKRYNPNPLSKAVGDCTVRALSAATGESWDKTYIALCAVGYELADMPSANAVWGEYLRRCGFERCVLPSAEPVTVAEFTAAHPRGAYVLALSGHVVTAVDGAYCDAWDSGAEEIIYIWRRV